MSRFITSVRTKIVSEFKPASLSSLVASFERHLRYSARMIMSAHIFVEVISTYASVTNLEYLHGIITLFHHLTTLGQQNTQTTR